MRVERKEPPREYTVGVRQQITIRDCGRVHLDDDEQLTFVHQGKEYDFTAKDWGFYITQSINARVKENGFRIALIKSLARSRFFLFAVNTDRMEEFHAYLQDDQLELVQWMDDLIAADAER